MPFNELTYTSLKTKAKEHIRKGELKQFVSLLNNATYASTMQIEQWDTSAEPEDSYAFDPQNEVIESYYYLYNEKDLKEFFNYALFRDQKEVIEWIWRLTSSPENVEKFLHTPFLFPLGYLQLYAEQNECREKLQNFEVIFQQLSVLEKTITDLESRGHHTDAIAAYQLARNIQLEMLRLVESQQPNALEQFKARSSAHIEVAKDKALSNHRGYKEVLINLSLAIAGGGVLYLIAATVNLIRTNGKHFFFKFDTETDKVVDQMDVTINTMR